MKWPGRAPLGKVLLRVFVGGALQPQILDAGDDELVALAGRELNDLIGINGEPQLQRVGRWMRSMPQYHVGHLARLARIDDRLTRHRGLYLAGNGYRGVGIPHCIHSGEIVAEKLIEATDQITAV
jgi:oxygen-dependent protoporphyrinogen oxidase